MTDEKETKLEIVKTPKAIQEIQNTINDVVPKVATMGQNMGKDIAKAFRKAYENMGYEFKEIENDIEVYQECMRNEEKLLAEEMENQLIANYDFERGDVKY